MSNDLANKYRPFRFDEVIGQPNVDRMKAALDAGTLGHSLIFCGTRGVGKTTVARILAAHYNCEACYPPFQVKSTEEWAKKETRIPVLGKDIRMPFHHAPEQIEPCGECMSCRGVRAGVNTAVIEVDAASNTGVDNVRELIEATRYSVPGGGYRVIILDEAHMLSKNAFNCLLKTLEEPPPRVIFILCTTEPHKLLDTIKSRCSIYEFQDVDLEILKEHYRTIAEAEGLPITEEGLNKLALTAEGSVRDGLTILQTAGEAASDSTKEYFRLVGAIYNQDVITALDVVQELRKTNEPRIIIQMLEKWFYYCSLESFGMKTPVRDYFGEAAPSNFDLGRLQESFKTCLEVERNFTATPNSKIVLDMGVIKLCL